MKVPMVSLDRENVLLIDEHRAAFERVLCSGWYLMGPEVAAYEAATAAWHGRKFGVAVHSGTSACELALRATGWKTVAMPAFGAVPTINAAEAARVTPVLVDVDPITRGVTHETLATAKADGAIVVHMYGHPCDVPADAIEDCAHAQGAKKDGRLVGSLGSMGTLSHFPTKCLGNMGDGGVIVTDSEEYATGAKMVRHYGRYDNAGDIDGVLGTNSRMSEMSAAFLSVKLPHLHHWNAMRRRIAARYNYELAGKVTVPQALPGCEPSFHVYVIESDERDRLKAALTERGIGCQIHYDRPLNHFSRWKHLGEHGQFPVSEKLARTVLSIPMGPYLTEQEQDEVIAAVKAST